MTTMSSAGRRPRARGRPGTEGNYTGPPKGSGSIQFREELPVVSSWPALAGCSSMALVQLMNDIPGKHRMAAASEHELRILTEIASKGEVSQRALAKDLGIALGLTNLYMKRLVRKGFVKIGGVH